MITNANVIAYFAESVRVEASGQHSFIGVFDDILELPKLPSTLPTLAIHLTLSTLFSDPFLPIKFQVYTSTGETILSHAFPEDAAEHQAEAIKKRLNDTENPWIRMKALINLAGVPVDEGMKLQVKFIDSKGEYAISNSLIFRSKRKETTLVSAEEPVSSHN